MRGGQSLFDLWWWNKCSFQSLSGYDCFTFFQQKFSHSLGCWPFLMALIGFSHAFCHFWGPLMGTVSAFPSPYLQWGAGAYLRCLNPTLPQTSCFQLQSQEVWASFHPLCLGREIALDPWLCRGSLSPALTPGGHVWSLSLMGGISPGLVSHLPLRPLLTAVTFCSFPKNYLLRGVVSLYIQAAALLYECGGLCAPAHCPPSPDSSAPSPEPGHCVSGN